MQANIWNAHSNAPYNVHELAPPTCVLKVSIDPFPFIISLLLCQVLPLSLVSLFLAPFTIFSLIFVHYFSPFVINDHKGLKYR